MAAEASSEAASNVQSGLALSAATRLTSPSISLAMASLLTRRRLGVRVVGIGLVGFVMADDATGRCAELAVSRHVAGGAADDGALDAAFRLDARGRSVAIAAAKTAANIHFMAALRNWKPQSQFYPAEVVPDCCAAKGQASVCLATTRPPPRWYAG
jgi:hypothetical protein